MEKPINFIAMKNTLASLWEPRKGTNIFEIEVLFQFFHGVDVNEVLNMGLWNFNQNLLVLKCIGG